MADGPSVGQGASSRSAMWVSVDGRFAITGQPFARFPTGVPQLDDGDRPFQFDEAHDPFGSYKKKSPVKIHLARSDLHL